jgi:hypothetical protein
MTTGNVPTRPGRLLVALVAAGSMVLAGCSNTNTGSPPQADAAKATTKTPPAEAHAAEIEAERGKLSPEDRALVDAQEWCAVTTTEPLGSMGPPLKVLVKDRPVFICCKGCQRKALADPDKTLAAVAELKAKAKAGQEKR